MKKRFEHTELSKVSCAVPGCTRKLKQRIVDTKPTARVCYRHYKILRRKSVSDRDIRRTY